MGCIVFIFLPFIWDIHDDVIKQTKKAKLYLKMSENMKYL